MDDQGFAAERDALRLEYQDKMARHYGVSFEAWLAHELTESRKLRSQETARFLGVMMDARRVLRDWALRPLPDLPPSAAPEDTAPAGNAQDATGCDV